MGHSLYLVQLILKVLECGLVGFNELASGLGLLVSIFTDFVGKKALEEKNFHKVKVNQQRIL